MQVAMKTQDWIALLLKEMLKFMKTWDGITENQSTDISSLKSFE